MYSLIAPPQQTVLPLLNAKVQNGVCVSADSRKIRAGDIFIAYQGEYADGRAYIQAAIEQGASFVFWEDDGKFQWCDEWQVPHQGIEDLRCRAGMLAAKLYDTELAKPVVWGVTGTNGKTSITQWLAQASDILNDGQSCAVIGTVGNGFWHHLRETTHTTPDAVSIQTLLNEFTQQGAKHVAMEVSSHGLDQFRVNGVSFRSAIFTNLTRDHLDYHSSMQEYGAVKSRLFFWQGLQHAVINSDDEYGAILAHSLKQKQPSLQVYTYGFNGQADICITEFSGSNAGMRVKLQTPWGNGTVQTCLLGRFNAQNLAACVGLLCANGYDFEQVLMALEQIRPAMGRMDCIIQANRPLVVVDYAHTPDALEKALLTLREIQQENSRLWCVFGCGGNRDRGKRPLMGAVAAANSDCVVVTSDNPRMEEPQAIIDDILPAVGQATMVEVDRRKAIEQTIFQAASQDIILIAGKGHENYQDILGVKHHFSDFEIAQSALDQWQA